MPEKINVCFVATFAYSLYNPKSEAPFGGSETQIYLLSRELAKDPLFDVHAVVGHFGQDPKESHEGVTVHRGFKLRRRFRYLSGLPAQLKFVHILKKINADVYIQRAAGVDTGITAFFCRRFRKKFIFMTASSSDVNGKFREINRLFNTLYTFGLKRADVILVQGEEYQQTLRETFGLQSTVFRSVHEIPLSNPSHANKDSVLWVGSSQPLKRPEIFLVLARECPSVPFVMIMPPNSHHPDLFRRISEAAKPIKNLTFIERVPFQEVDRYFQRAKVFVNTSTYEGFPNTFVQALKQGTPVLSLTVNPDRFLDTHGVGSCAADDPHRLHNLLQCLLTDETLWQKQSASGLLYARKYHELAEGAARLKEIILRLHTRD